MRSDFQYSGSLQISCWEKTTPSAVSAISLPANSKRQNYETKVFLSPRRNPRLYRSEMHVDLNYWSRGVRGIRYFVLTFYRIGYKEMDYKIYESVYSKPLEITKAKFHPMKSQDTYCTALSMERRPSTEGRAEIRYIIM